MQAIAGTTVTMTKAATATATGVTTEFHNIERISAPDFAAGYWYVGHCRYFTVPYSHLADFTSASVTLTNVERGDGVSSLTGNIAVDDWIELWYLRRPVLNEFSGRITAFNNTAQTITIDGTANYTATRERLDRFIRALPANA